MATSQAEATQPKTTSGFGEPLYQPKDGKANVDIVFVHGVNGDKVDTWTWKDGNPHMFWPQKLLPDTLPKARILSFGYNAKFAKFFPETNDTPLAPELTIDHYTNQLLHALRVVREGEEKERPIIFVAHSMGGLVVANALSGKVAEDVQQTIVDRTIGILFLGTPFLGSSLARYGEMAMVFLGHIINTKSSDLEVLKKNSKKLADLNQAFAIFLKERDRAHDKAPSHLWNDLFVVPAASATWLGIKALSIDADHREMCRFKNQHSRGYKDVSGMLKHWIEYYENNKTAGGVHGLKAQGINIAGNVDYRGATFNQAAAMGHVFAMKENAINFRWEQNNSGGSSNKDNGKN
ncbi:Alpha/Beta hydrolase protein [Podospora fimiseda]|uniref:Alpha/Beta hydrolase protein n=1 Tax=Podospora fimiseda TaxID=252190 RepID=A0AAN7BLR4_9PEZI|nr:Alpha/Beta hydrolase protein [Podospora fimiseda]